VNVPCQICGKPVDPVSKQTLQRVTGWQRMAMQASRRGGSDILARETVQEWAHPSCVDRAKNGIHHDQDSLL
jgi:hypothetical protein